MNAFRVCAAALMFSAVGVSAQEIQKLVDADGKVTYTNVPDASVAQPVRKAGMSARRAALVDDSESSRRLVDARLQREQGSGPQPGEHSGGAGIGPLNDRYWKRQELLRRDVELALARSNETRRLLITQR